jgi:histidyl-tRNA synthetase
MAEKPSIPKGTRDFSPEVMVKRNYIFENIKQVYRHYGFMPIETPAMENLSTLMGKYGEEGDRLIFKILSRGDKFKRFIEKIKKLNVFKKSDSADNESNEDENLERSISSDVSEEGLRYDLTVPFARFVVQHRNDLTFPFKRYQIQPVWRADRPQKGRYREFYQCDADVIGSDSLLNEVELIQIMQQVYKNLGLAVLIKINNRKILSGIAEVIEQPDKIIDITVAIDKLDKIGIDKVNQELKLKGIPDTAIEKIQPLMELKGTTAEKIKVLRSYLKDSEIGQKGLEELEYLFTKVSALSNEADLIDQQLEFDITLARGLNYYTGAIFEVKPNDSRTDFKGSICGGGRYDDLTGVFGMPGVSGVGISFGADRIFDVLEDIKLFPDFQSETTKILFVNFGQLEEDYCLGLLRKIRNMGINAEIYPEPAKMKKQMAYADGKKIPLVALVGIEEMNAEVISVKDMKTGLQQKYILADLIELLKN